MDQWKANEICPLAWLHVSFNADSSARVCCNTDHDGRIRDDAGNPIFLEDIQSAEEYFNNSFMKSLRLQMLEGKKPDFCRKCYISENETGHSLRKIYHNQYYKQIPQMIFSTQEDGSTFFPKISLDFSLSNNCNLKCRMCTPGASHSIAKDYEKLGIAFDKTWSDKAHIGWASIEAIEKIKEMAINAKEILTTGGEPLTNATHRALIKHLVETKKAKEITLRYHSNLMVLPEELLDLWTNFQKIELHISLEAAGEINDYIRYPSRWSQIDKNIRKLMSLKEHLPLSIEFHTCLLPYNLQSMPELISYIHSLEGFAPSIPYFNWIDHPEEMSVLSLPKSFRQKHVAKIKNYLETLPDSTKNTDAFKSFVQNLKLIEEAPEDFKLQKKFLDLTLSLDSLRQQNFSSMFPEIRDYLIESLDKNLELKTALNP